jgi:hypothetical protein
MASGLVLRYAALVKKPLNEMEELWRACKRQASQSGKRNQWDVVVNGLRERLNIKNEDGRVVFLEGKAESAVLSETPDYILLQVRDIDSAPEELRECLTKSQGVITTTYDRISHSEGGSPIQTSFLKETMSMDVGSGSSGGFAPVGKIYLAPGLNVKHNGKKAKVSSVGSHKSKIKYYGQDGVESTDEVEVHNNTLGIEETFLTEHLIGLWRSMNSDLGEAQRLEGFKNILMFENQLTFVPTDIVESIVNTAKEEPFVFDDSDWAVLLDQDVAQKPLPTLPLPRQPERMGDEETPPDGGSDDPEKPSPADDGEAPHIRTPSTGEIQRIARSIKGEGKNGKKENWLLESLKKAPPAAVNAESLRPRRSKKPVSGGESDVERQARQANKWDTLAEKLDL